MGSEWTDVSNDTIKGKIMDTARTNPRNMIGRSCCKCNERHIIKTPALVSVKLTTKFTQLLFFLHVHHNPANQDFNADRQLFDDTYIS